jgi:Bacterial Ig domain/Lysyl oxidase
MSGTTLHGDISYAARRTALAVVLVLGLCLAVLPGLARAAEPLLPDVVADPPNNVFLETSTTEGGLKGSGEAKLLLRFNGYLHNVGPGALDFRGSRSSPAEPMHAFQRVYNSDGTFKEEPSSAELIYVATDGHEHFHLQRAAKYSLWNAAKSAEVAPAQKVGFCLDDSEHVEPAIGPSVAVYSDATGRKFCRQHEPEALNLFEGVSIGWRDRYDASLAFQWVDASSVLPGEYWLREDVNPTGVIKEAGGAKTPGYSTKATIVPGFDALAQAASTQPAEPRTVTLTSKAWSDTATAKYKIVSAPSHGTLSAVSGNQVTYTPSAGYSGPDSFTFSASDPNSPFPKSPAVATVAIEIAAGASKALLAGDATTAYSVGDQTTSGREEAFQFTAKSTGTVEELQFRTNTVANTGVTGLSLGVFADSSGKPGELLGRATVSGEPATSSWIRATGLSTPVVSGTKYWLVALPLGGSTTKLHYNAAVASGGTGNVESTAGGLSAMTAEASWETYNQGPVGFQALGTTSTTPSVTIEGAPASMTAGTSVQLTAHVTNDSPTVTWTASAGSITAGGLYTAPSEPPAGGKALVTATTSKGASDQRSIEIVIAPPPSVTIEGAPASMTAGTSVQLTAHVTNDSPTVTWTASAGSITAGGLYTAPSEPPAGGKALVTATTSKGASDQRSIEIVTTPPPSVTIEGAPASMTAGTSVQLTAHVTNDSPTVTWKASAGSITTGGLYTAPSEPPAGGKAVVSATTSKGASDQRSIEILAAATKGLLAGDATTTYSVGDQTTSGREEAFQFTAKSTGTVEELQFRTNATANTGVTGITIGVFADSAGKPGAVLGRSTVSGQPATSSWIKATGLSTAVVSATKYWLVVLPLGPSGTRLHFNAAAGVSGGTGNVESTVGGLTTMTAEASWETYNQGPVGFQALGHISGASAVKPVASARPVIAARARVARLAPRPRRHRARVMIEGAPAGVVAGTSVQLSALVAHGGSEVTWRASEGSITAQGLYTAPSHVPPGASIVLSATGRNGARDRRRIRILPVTSAQPAPSAPLASAAQPYPLARVVTPPQAVIVAGKLVMTTRFAAAGQAGLSAYVGTRRIGACVVLTPAERNFTCRLSLAGVSPGASISVWAVLRAGRRILQSSRGAAPIPRMSMPALAGVRWLGNASASALPQFLCSPPIPSVRPSSAVS